MSEYDATEFSWLPKGNRFPVRVTHRGTQLTNDGHFGVVLLQVSHKAASCSVMVHKRHMNQEEIRLPHLLNFPDGIVPRLHLRPECQQMHAYNDGCDCANQARAARRVIGQAGISVAMAGLYEAPDKDAEAHRHVLAVLDCLVGRNKTLLQALINQYDALRAQCT